MAEEVKTSYTGRLKNEIKENERRIEDLQKKLKDHDDCQPRINKLEEEIKRLNEEIKRLKEVNKTLEEKIRSFERDLEKSNTYFEKEMNEKDEQSKIEIGKLKAKIGKLEEDMEQIKKSELSEDELIIRQLGSSVQVNILRIVLKNDFDVIQNKRTKYMEDYISMQIEDEDKQNEARERWKKLSNEINWKECLIKQLQPVKMSGNETAHPELTEPKIENAKINLKDKKKLSKHMVKAVDTLKDIWKTTNSKLPKNGLGPRTSSAESRDRGVPPNNLFATGQSQGTYASKVAGGRYDISTKA